MSHEIETMAFAHQTPWHGLGARVDAAISTSDMLVAAGLDWQVERVPLFAQDDPEPVAGSYALRRATDRKVMGVVGDRWKPVQNSEILEFFRSYVEAGDATMETAGSLRGGKQVWALANLRTGFTLRGGDTVKGYLLLIGSHESGRATIARTTSVRVVCANTLALAMRGKSQAEVRWSHARSFSVDAARQQMGIARDTMSEFERNARLLQKLRISRDDAVRILAPAYQPQAEVADLLSGKTALAPSMVSVLTQAEKAPGATPGNGWGLLNGVTYHADHVAGRRSSRDQALATAWFGTEAARKDMVLTSLLQLAQ